MTMVQHVRFFWLSGLHNLTNCEYIDRTFRFVLKFSKVLKEGQEHNLPNFLKIHVFAIRPGENNETKVVGKGSNYFLALYWWIYFCLVFLTRKREPKPLLWCQNWVTLTGGGQNLVPGWHSHVGGRRGLSYKKLMFWRWWCFFLKFGCFLCFYFIHLLST